MSEDRVLEALRALRDADAQREMAGPELEARLRQALRRRKWWAWRRAAVGIAAGVVGLGVGLAALWSGVNRPAERLTIAAAPLPAPPVMAIAQSEPEPELHEVVTEFYPLMDTPPPFERGELVRVSLHASTLLRAGFMVEGSGVDDSVEAEVLVGEEGLARAIRFVSYQ